MPAKSNQCLICDANIVREVGPGKRQDYHNKRGPQAVTCSRKCSKIYERVYRYLVRSWRKKRLENGK